MSTTIFNVLLLGLSLLILLNSLTLYIFHKKPAYLLFATAVFWAMLSNVLTTSLAGFYFPTLNYNWVFKIENFAAYMLVPTVGLFLYHFMEEKKRTDLKLLFTLGLLFGIAMLILPLHVYRKYLTIVDVYVLLAGFYILVFYLIPKTIREPGKTLLSLVALAIMYVAGINDILNHFGVIQTVTLAYSGILAYILVQSYHINQLFFDLFKKNIKLNEELDFKNKNLELLVAERTAELNDTNEELKQQSEELRANAEVLQETNVLLEEKQQELWIQAEQLSTMNQKIALEQKHRLDSIRYAKTIQEAILTPLERYREFFDSFVLYKPKDIVSGDFYWAGTSKLLPETVYVAVIDCTGHGVPGGFMSMLSSRMLIDIVAKFPTYKTGEIVTALDQLIRESLNQKESS
ncbi:MAG TPA: hypothetical protein DCQ31_14795, partial [Bacteroidales bacterium]|nr:hypothetical protein [Bacteroidales bacterium]